MQACRAKAEQPTEFEIQATLWWKLNELGFNVRGEYSVKYHGGRKGSKCRFDLVQMLDGVAVGIIEVKDKIVKHKHGFDKTRQGRRYASYGVPVLVVYGMSQAESLIRLAENRGFIFEP